MEGVVWMTGVVFDRCDVDARCGVDDKCGVDERCGVDARCGVDDRCGVDASCGIRQDSQELAYLNEIGEYDCVDAKKANAALPLNRQERKLFVGKSKEEINVLVRVKVSET
ncbi:hypothetical protein Pcinc_028906 [Petrolisthes cinctipes]|uniref:Uncharacterized protein n=1 Tax=Petrolisthes cinctipes TaxID=88211 RepID=A0AAE1F286_PETCI|nr:hypothetical protein Pcinc_028906 [Petrolisthes cinctipes]